MGGIYKRPLHCLREIAEYADGIGLSITQLVILGEKGRPLRFTEVLPQAHEIGLLVHPYTLRADQLPPPIRSIGHACEILFHHMKIDGIFTDFPDKVVEYLTRSGLKKRR